MSTGTDWHINDEDYHRWIAEVEQPRLLRRLAAMENLAYGPDWPLISVVMPCYNSAPRYLTEAVESLLAQIYTRWELVLVDDASTTTHVRPLIREFSQKDQRIKALYRSENGGIAQATNDGLAQCQGQFLALLDHDDVIPPQALLLVAREVHEHSEARLLYSDSDNLNQQGRRCNPFFKPDWNPDLLLGQNYLNHLTVYQTALLRNLGGLRDGFDGSQDYDLALRALERLRPNQVRHLPDVLYHWRIVEHSVARGNMGLAVKRARRAVVQHLGRCGLQVEVDSPPQAKIFNRVHWPAPAVPPHWTIIRVPAGATGAELNRHVARAKGDHLCLLPAGFEPGSAADLDTLARLLARPGAGLACPSLWDINRRLLLGPLFTSTGDQGLPAPGFAGAATDSKGYFGRLALEQRVIAASSRALAVRREVLEQVGGFNPALRHPHLLGTDLALRLRGLDRWTVWTPYARFHQQDAAPVARQPAASGDELETFRSLWRREIQRDPGYNPNLSRRQPDFTLDLP